MADFSSVLVPFQTNMTGLFLKNIYWLLANDYFCQKFYYPLNLALRVGLFSRSFAADKVII